MRITILSLLVALAAVGISRHTAGLAQTDGALEAQSGNKAVAAPKAEIKVQRDLPYVQPRQRRQLLDVYTPAEGKDHPILIWLHGGAWKIGDKSNVQDKPQAFVDQGFVFVSMNYRFVPDVNIKEMTGDVATAIKWVYDHASDYGGNNRQIFVAGHSAGAHLAALVCTDESYLQGVGLKLANISGCIPVDTATYDIPQLVSELGRVREQTYTSVFGEDAASQKQYSPLTYVTPARKIATANNKQRDDTQADETKTVVDKPGKAPSKFPPFLILHVASRRDSTAQSQAFAKALLAAGGKAQIFAGENKTHATINRELGHAGDPPTEAVFAFLRERLQAKDAAK